MKLRLTFPITLAFAMLLAAFSTGSPVFLLAGVMVLLVCLSGVLGVWMAARSMTVSGGVSEHIVQRGEKVTLAQALATSILFSVSMNLTTLGTSWKWN